MIEKSIRKLICYGLEKGLFSTRDEVYVTNLLLDALRLDGISCSEKFENVDLKETLDEILDYAESAGLIEGGITERDLFDTKIMGFLLPRPSEVTNKFYDIYEKSPLEATEFFYKFSCDSNYIRRDRVARDLKWKTETDFGELDITINLSKPEKDPKAIAAAKSAPQSGYPKCLLCRECEGYAGRIDFPARQNHRVIPVTINNSSWYFQYSPYV
ncbi:MAG: galactose-1-phosphate uridylyltransferase, partial [Clostridia bacterium]|nr:galactose-1-phosphate uridylyltransferase [Clostridia bacterium]